MATVARLRRTGSAPHPELDFARKPFYSPSEIAEILGISTQSVLDRVHEGRLYAVRISPRIYRIPLGSFFQFLGEPPRIKRSVRRVKSLPGWSRTLASEERSR